MRKVFYTLGLTVVFNVAVAAQSTAKSPDQRTNKAGTSSKAASSSKVSKTSNSGPTFFAVSNVQAQLQNTLDARNAKVGDEVVLKTTDSIVQDGQLVIPKGSQLFGRVTEVQQRAKNGAASKLGLIFDRLGHGGAVMPITATIVSITNANAGSALDQGMLDSDLSGSSSTSTRGSSGGSGGGLLGGVTNTVGGVLNSTTQTVGGATNTAGQALGSTTSTLGQTINGLQISTSASGSAQSSTTLSSQNKNVHLDKGVTFNLNVQKSGEN